MNESKITKIFDGIDLQIVFDDIDKEFPISYQKRYSYKAVTISKSLKMIFIMEERSGSIDTFINQAEFLSNQVNLPYTLVFTSVNESTKAMLLKARIPFMDYKGNIYIPSLGLLLEKNLEVISLKEFTPSEQLVFISILLNDGDFIDINRINLETNVSIPTIYRALNRFVKQGWTHSEHNLYQVLNRKTEIFQSAIEYFVNPIYKTIYVDDQNMIKIEKAVSEELRDAGLKALSFYTMIDEEKNIKAISSKTFKVIERKLKIRYLEKKLPDYSELQLWKYSPINYDNNHQVDPISLYFSIQETDDPRITIEQKNLLKLITEILEG